MDAVMVKMGASQMRTRRSNTNNAYLMSVFVLLCSLFLWKTNSITQPQHYHVTSDISLPFTTSDCLIYEKHRMQTAHPKQYKEWLYNAWEETNLNSHDNYVDLYADYCSENQEIVISAKFKQNLQDNQPNNDSNTSLEDLKNKLFDEYSSFMEFITNSQYTRPHQLYPSKLAGNSGKIEVEYPIMKFKLWLSERKLTKRVANKGKISFIVEHRWCIKEDIHWTSLKDFVKTKTSELYHEEDLHRLEKASINENGKKEYDVEVKCENQKVKDETIALNNYKKIVETLSNVLNELQEKEKGFPQMHGMIKIRAEVDNMVCYFSIRPKI